MEKIISLQNIKIKDIMRLSRSNERKEKELTVIEGYREISMAFNAGFQIMEIYYSTEVNLHPQAFSIIDNIPNKFEVSRKVFEKIAYREHSDGLIAIAKPKYLSLDNLKLSDDPIILILEAVEKPGNLGAILRTTDAAGIDAVIICDPQTDLFNPNVIRSSLGCIFTNQVVACSNTDTLDFLIKRKIKSYAASLNTTYFYQNTDFTIPCAIIMGSESNGLTDFWLNNADQRIKIPMMGKVDSLNVSVSSAILVFEAKRQRGF